MSGIGTRAQFVRRPEIVVERVIGDETPLFNSVSGRFYLLNDTAGTIWRSLDQPRTVAEVVSLIAEEFAVEPEQCFGAVSAFLDDLEKAGLIDVILS
jgi:PqqD family protein of HPr-rel-A system